MELLAAHEVIAEYYAIDVALHPNEIIDEFKERQAAALTQNLTPMHAEAIARRLHDEPRRFARWRIPQIAESSIRPGRCGTM